MQRGNGTTYRFVELAPQHQIALLRQEILRLEQQLYALVMQQEATETRKGLVLAELQRLARQVEAIVRPPPPAEAVAPEPGSITPMRRERRRDGPGAPGRLRLPRRPGPSTTSPTPPGSAWPCRATSTWPWWSN